MSVVIDASVVGAWAFADERSAKSAPLLTRVGQHGARVPAHWPLEVLNLLLSAERRGRMARGERNEFLKMLGRLPIRVEAASIIEVERIVDLADAHKLTSYDAGYLELAFRMRLPLATKDEQLAEAGPRIGVEILAV